MAQVLRARRRGGGGREEPIALVVCCCLGFAANVAQLVGLDVASLVKEIKERVQTVSQNKEDCELLAERAELILDLLGRLQKSKVIEDPDMWKPTERLRSTLRRACEVIEFCRERSCTYRFCKSDHTAKELRKVLKALKFCVTHLTALVTIINGDQTTRYFLVQQTPDVVQLQDGVLAPALGLPAQHFKYNDRNDRGETLGISGKAQLVTEPSSVNEPGLKRFAFSQLEVATDNFSLENQIGVGAFSIVYQGQLNEGLEVAVKRASYVDKIPFHQLENELDLIPKLQHTNMRVFTVLEERRYQIQVVHYAPSNGCKGLVRRGTASLGKQVPSNFQRWKGRVVLSHMNWKGTSHCLLSPPQINQPDAAVGLPAAVTTGELLGYCTRKRERILVFEYMPNRSLDSFITGERATKEPLDWPKRSQIVRGIAQGAVYLHKLCEPRIIHGGLKPGNILLDASLKPKICDFGISKALKADADKDCTGVVVGSRGFMAPEYKQGGCLSLQTDVYSFGATLLQIIRGKHISPSSLALSDESRNYGPLNKWAWNLWKDGNLMELIDPSLHDETHAAEMKRWVQIALLCVQQSPEERPSMWDVLLMLSCDSVILPEPKLPAYYC
uniref:Protein kinase domain-containing protein n=1 Tax=Oryza barthii TaxID=65489 RepID=A0A0D3HPR4_9ORYZ